MAAEAVDKMVWRLVISDNRAKFGVFIDQLGGFGGSVCADFAAAVILVVQARRLRIGNADAGSVTWSTSAEALQTGKTKTDAIKPRYFEANWFSF